LNLQQAREPFLLSMAGAPAAKRQRQGEQELQLDGESLSTDVLYSASTGKVRIKLSEEARAHAAGGRAVVDSIMASGEVAYGINTGFGLFANVRVSDEQLRELQENLIRSHACCVGAPITPERTRMLLALRINSIAKGHSGISLQVLDQMIAAFNADCLPVIPAKGTVSNGDLAPLAHLALGLMGEGEMWDPKNPGTKAPAADVLKASGLSPIRLAAKEGLAMINGTQFITSLGAEAVTRAENVAKTADCVIALTLEVLCGTVRAYHPLIHASRPHSGQQLVASRIRALLQPDSPSDLFESHKYVGRVQDAYSLRCVPQVHGICNDTITFVRNILNTELNASTDNPMVFTREQADASEPMGFKGQPGSDNGKNDSVKNTSADSTHFLYEFAAKPADASDISDLEKAREEIAALRKSLTTGGQKAGWSFFKKQTDLKYTNAAGGVIMSGGNFHGEYPAKVLDYLAIAVHEIAAISERRIERLTNPSLSGLPAFLVKEGGLNSGFMIAHCTAASLVSENKVLCHPASVDSISTSASKEDHVSMGGFAARKALEVVEHVETVIAIELLASCQALEFHRPKTTTKPLEAVHALVRSKVKAWDKDRIMAPDIDAVLKLVQSGAVLEAVRAHMPDGTF